MVWNSRTGADCSGQIPRWRGISGVAPPLGEPPNAVTAGVTSLMPYRDPNAERLASP